VEPVDLYYSPTDDQLRAYAQLSPPERLRRLDDLRRFVIMLREAPTVNRRAAEPDPAPYG
jgi:hypothetical protein